MIGEAEKEGRGEEVRERLEKFQQTNKIKAASVLVVAIGSFLAARSAYWSDPDSFLPGIWAGSIEEQHHFFLLFKEVHVEDEPRVQSLQLLDLDSMTNVQMIEKEKGRERELNSHQKREQISFNPAACYIHKY